MRYFYFPYYNELRSFVRLTNYTAVRVRRENQTLFFRISLMSVNKANIAIIYNYGEQMLVIVIALIAQSICTI